MKNLTTNTKDDSSGQHDRKSVLKPTESEDKMTNNTEGSSYDQDPSRPNFINKHSTQERNDDIRKSIKSIQQVEL